MLVLTDKDIEACLPMGAAVAAMRSAFLSEAAGTMVSEPRQGFRVGDAGLVWTPGGFVDRQTMGLRLYATGVPRSDQLVALWGTATGELRCVALGSLLGRLRTGAIGGVAIDALARPDATVVGVIGFGQQAWQQVEAALAVRPIRRVQAYRRDRAELERQVALGAERWGLEVVACADAREAAGGADIVVTATNASLPVVRAAWLEPGAHVNALGPKYAGANEIDLDLAEAASTIACDFPDQYRRESDFFLHATSHMARMVRLSDLVARPVRRSASDVTLFLSHGLAGTEVRLLEEAQARAAALGLGMSVALGPR